MINSVLLHSKFLYPKLVSNHLQRPHLISQLNANLETMHLALIAPAGYGKTTLLTEFAQAVDRPLVWLQLDDSDNDPAMFMAYLLKGFLQQFDDIQHLSINVEDVDNIQPERSLTILLNELLENPNRQGVLILDDYHVIINPIVHELIVTLLENLPIGLRVILASRKTPNLPFARWRTQHLITELRATHLRFSDDEIRQWLSQQSIDSHNEVWKSLSIKTEGWCAGLQLAVLLMNEQGSRSPEEITSQLTGSQPYIFDYLMTEVLANQPPDVRTFLLESSVFSAIHPHICQQILETDNTYQILKSLQRDNLFIVQLDHQQDIYRYHELFRDFLLNHFKQENHASYRRIQLKVARYFEEQGDYEIAIEHYINIDLIDDAMRMFRLFARPSLNQGRFEELSGYLQMFEERTPSLPSDLLLVRGQILCRYGHYADAIRTLNEARQRLESTHTQPNVLCAILTELAEIRHSQGYYQLAFELAQAAAEVGQQTDEPYYIFALMQMAQCAGFMDGMKKGREIAEQAIDHLKRRTHLLTAYQEARLLGTMAQICWWHGDVRMTVQHCNAALQRLNEQDSPLRAKLLILLATPLLYRQDYQTALHHAETALQICQNLQLRERLPAAYSTLGNVLTRLGELDRAEICLRQAINIGHEIGGASYVQVMSSGFLAQNLALQGRTDEAHQVAAIHRGEPVLYEYYVCQSVLADLLLDSQQFQQAKTIYEMLIEYGQQRQYRIPLAMAYFGLAYILLLQEQRQQAVEYSRSSLALLEPGMVQQLYLDQRERAIIVCRTLLDEMPASAFVQTVYDTLQTTIPRQPLPQIQATLSPQIHVQTLGTFRVFRDGIQVPTKQWQSAKARDALACFITHRDKAIPLDRIIYMLWENDTGSSTAFHTALYRLRKALRRDTERTKFILSEVGEYRLDASCFQIDVDQFHALLHRAKSAPVESVMDLYEAAIDLYRGEYMENLYYAWVLPTREELERKYIEALVLLSRLKQSVGDLNGSIELINKAIVADPYREPLYCQAMRLHHQLSDRHAIQFVYNRLCDKLQSAFSATPRPETDQLLNNLLGSE